MTTGKQNEKYQVKIVPTAKKDLRDAAMYVAQNSPANARKFVADVRARINDVLVNSPNICLPPRAYPFLAEQGYFRFSVHTNYSALWVWNGSVIEIHRILHNKRNWTLIMGGPEDIEEADPSE
ncbi:type II toxin-antitoxin system RelE/ParE family toxin [Sporomusa acidovorans]|uniref:type II toxin-antitoxin system RelE/ParE family toxin n=1 Tax=Sporomusa acidovorans TaxID=112900 RepID=UPI00088D09D6|nr:type II toxin-antitoxin system RelE/ParE family toxin [Sporomusa acidovorans]OZC19031.1 plasmid stabilization system protein [Sporomusa acidovorans DSM 3132]SDD73713.1 Plasmid stabilization system protein ParE [Sporomusa acidovorans]